MVDKLVAPSKDELLQEIVDFLTPPNLGPGWYTIAEIVEQMMAKNPALTDDMCRSLVHKRKQAGKLEAYKVGNRCYYRLIKG